MPVRANFQKSYLWRPLIMAGVGLVMAALFAYDGFIGYPKQREYAQAFESIAAEVEDKVERTKKWQEFAKSKGWPTETPEESPAEWDNKIQGQFWFGVPALLVGLSALYFYLTWRRQWIEATDDGLVTSWGQRLNYSDVTLLNKKRWENKGIAKATYAENGKQRTFVFDDFKFEREPLGQMLSDLEAVLKPEQIVGGITEAERKKQKEAEESA